MHACPCCGSVAMQACGGGQISGIWTVLSGIYSPDANDDLGCYASCTVGTSCSLAATKYVTGTTRNWQSNGFVFLR